MSSSNAEQNAVPGFDAVLASLVRITTQPDVFHIRYTYSKEVTPLEIKYRHDTLVDLEAQKAKESDASAGADSTTTKLLAVFQKKVKAPQKIVFTCDYISKGDRYIYQEDLLTTGPDGGPDEQLTSPQYICDGKHLVVLNEKSKTAVLHVALQTPPNTAGLWTDLVFKIDGVALLDYLKQFPKLDINYEGGELCVSGKILKEKDGKQWFVNVKCVLQPDTLLPAKITISFTESNVTKITFVREFKYSNSKVPMPIFVRDERYNYAQPETEFVAEIHTYKLVDFSANEQINDSDFSLHFPAGYFVTDGLTGESYTVGRPVDVIENIIKK